MRCLLYISMLCLAACSSAYKDLRETTGDPVCVQRFKPALGAVVYRTEVDVVGNHLSGLLVLKAMPDSSTRLVFTSEMGLTFFDFAFGVDGSFKVYHIIDKMDKKSVIKTLRKDFELILLEHTSQGKAFTDGVNRYYAFPQEKGTNYYITDSACTRLLRAEKASKRKTIVEARLMDYVQGVPDSVSIVHEKFHFTITLKNLHAAQ